MNYTKGWINIHMDETGHTWCSQGTYETKAEAESAIMIGYGIRRIATIEVNGTYDRRTSRTTFKRNV